MGFIDEQFDDYLMQDGLGLCDNNGSCGPEYDDSFLQARRQMPQTPGGVDWRYEKGGVYGDE